MGSTPKRKTQKVQVVRTQVARSSVAHPASASDAPALLLAQGNALMQRSRPAEAADRYRRALELQPELAAAWCNLGSALQATGQNGEAIECLERALSIHPGFAEAQFNLGNALKSEARLEESIERYAKCIALRPGFAPAHNNQGLALLALDRLDEAEAGFRKAIECDPRYVDAHYNLGIALREQSRPEDAVSCYDRALALRPEHASSRWNKALALLQMGHLEEGWPLYESRLGKMPALSRSLADRPVWTGRESLVGHTLLLRAEQGLGDTLQFCRYAPMLSAAGARVVLEVPESLVSVMHTLAGVDQVVMRGAALPEFDLLCPLLSLPLCLRTRADTIPWAGPYLSTAPDRIAHWTLRLGKRTRPRIGIAWSGNPSHANDRKRSIALEQLRVLVSPRLELVSLQNALREEERPHLTALGIRHFGDEIRDFGDTAALCSLVDVVVSVDTSVAHLAGAMGRPTWILLPRPADWRWLLDREDSPWYPNARLYRQHIRCDWSRVLESVHTGLQELAARAL